MLLVTNAKPETLDPCSPAVASASTKTFTSHDYHYMAKHACLEIVAGLNLQVELPHHVSGLPVLSLQLNAPDIRVQQTVLTERSIPQVELPRMEEFPPAAFPVTIIISRSLCQKQTYTVLV